MTANISRRRLIESSIVGTAALAGATSAFASKPVAKWDDGLRTAEKVKNTPKL